MSEKNSITENRKLFFKAYEEKNFFKASFLGEELIEQHKKTEKINSYEYCVDLYNVAFFYQKTGNIFKACKFHNENIEFFSNIKKFKENSYSKEYAEIFVDIFISNGICLASSNDYSISLKNFQQAFKICKEHLADTKKYLNCIYNLASAYFNLEDYDMAIKFYLEALYKTSSSGLDYADILNFLGYCYEEKEDYDKAIDYLSRALSIIKGLEGLSSKDYLANVSYLAGVYEDAKDYENSIKFLEKTLVLVENKFGDKSPHIPETLNKIANIYIKLNEPEKAIAIITKALNLIRNYYGKNHIFYTNNLKKIADIYFDIKDYKNALYYYQQELELKEKILGKDNGLYIETLINIAKVNLKLGDEDKLAEICNKIYGLIELEISNDLYEKSLLSLAKVFLEEKTEVLFQIYENLGRVAPTISFDEMLSRAKEVKNGIMKDLYIPKDKERSTHSIEKRLLKDLRKFLEKNLTSFDKIRNKIEVEEEKTLEENIEVKGDTPKNLEVFPEENYTQEDILDLLFSKNEDEEKEN